MINTKILISDSQYHRIFEQDERIDFSDYHDEDYIDAFFIFFRNWIKNKYGEEIFRYPISNLISRFSKEFIIDNLGENEFRLMTIRAEPTISKYTIPNIVKKLIDKKLYTLPSAYKEERFLDKYSDYLDIFRTQLDLPYFIDLKIEEPKPQKLTTLCVVNFKGWLLYDERYPIKSQRITHNLREYLENYMNIDFGNRAYGQTNLINNGSTFIGIDDWIKKDLKELKKEIKKLPLSKLYLKALRFKADFESAKLDIICIGDIRWNNRQHVKDEIKNFISSKGYGPNLVIDVV